MPGVTPQIWIVDEIGRPVVHIEKAEPFDIVVRLPETAEPADEVTIELTVGDQSTTLDVPLVGQGGGVLQYRLEGQRLDDDEVLFDSDEHDFSVTDGEALTIELDGSTDVTAEPFTGFAYEVAASRDTAMALEHLHQTFDAWNAFLVSVRRSEVQTEATRLAADNASGFLRMLGMGFEIIAAEIGSDRWDRRGRARALAKSLLLTIPSDIDAAVERGSTPRINVTGVGNYRGELYDVMERQGEVVADLRDHVFAQVTIGSYRGFVGYSGADVYWTAATNVYAKYDAWEDGDEDFLDAVGTDEMGKDKSATALAQEVAVDFIIDRAITKGIQHLEGGPELRFHTPSTKQRSGNDADLPAGVEAPPTPGRIIAPSEHGVRDDVIPKFQAAAKRHGVVVVLRPGNNAARIWQGLGFPGKGVEIKTKSLQPIDRVIGGPTSSGVAHGPDAPEGLIGFFDPSLPSRPPGMTDAEWDLVADGGRRPEGLDDVAWTEQKQQWQAEAGELIVRHGEAEFGSDLVHLVAKRYTQRRVEFEDNRAGLEQLQADGRIRIEKGLLIDTGLYGAGGLPITGDLDLFQILGPDGLPVPREKYLEVVEDMGLDPDMYIQHGAHERWTEDSPFERGSKEEGIFNAIMGGHTREELLVVGGFGDGLIRTTYVRELAPGEFELIATRDGRVLWAGGVIDRPSPLLSSIHPGPLHLDRFAAAGSVATRVSLPLLTNTDQAPASPEPSRERTPEEDAELDRRWAEQEERDRAFFEEMENQGPPEYSGPPGLLGPPDDTDPDEEPDPLAGVELEVEPMNLRGPPPPSPELTVEPTDVEGPSSSRRNRRILLGIGLVLLGLGAAAAVVLSGGDDAPQAAAESETDGGGLGADLDPAEASTDAPDVAEGRESDVNAEGETEGPTFDFGPPEDDSIEDLIERVIGDLPELNDPLGYPTEALDWFPDTGPDGIYSVEGVISDLVVDGEPPPGSAIEGLFVGLFESEETDVDLRFNRSTHPCGLDDGDLRVTCPVAAGPFPAGEEVVVIVALDALVEDGSTFTYGLAFDDDADDGDNYQFGAPFDWDYFRNSELWYRLEIAADGTRRMWAETGMPGRVEPRYSAALVVEFDRFLAWIVPRSEVPGDELVVRATAFRNEGDPTTLPVPATSAGDVSGEDPAAPLQAIDTSAATPVDVGGATLADVEAPIARVDPGPDPEQALRDAMVAEFAGRVDAAFAGRATVDELLSLLHPAVIGNFGTEEQCRALIERTIVTAEGYAVTGPAALLSEEGPVGFVVPVEYRYPTGVVANQDLVLATGDGRVGWLFDCAAAVSSG